MIAIKHKLVSIEYPKKSIITESAIFTIGNTLCAGILSCVTFLIKLQINSSALSEQGTIIKITNSTRSKVFKINVLLF